MKIFFFTFFGITIVQIVFHIYKLVQLKGQYPQFKYLLSIQLITQFIGLINYLLARYYTTVSLLYSSVVSILIMVSSLEISIVQNPTYEFTDGSVLILTMISTVSAISYD